MIEMSSPEELFPDLECVAIAKGYKKVASVVEARKVLLEHSANKDGAAVKDIEKVNTPFRRELVRKKTNELTAQLSNANPKDEELHMMLDMFDYLAIDWVYSDELRWVGSLADSYSKKILEYALRP